MVPEWELVTDQAIAQACNEHNFDQDEYRDDQAYLTDQIVASLKPGIIEKNMKVNITNLYGMSVVRP